METKTTIYDSRDVRFWPIMAHSEPMAMHLLKKFSIQWNPRCGAYNGIDATLRTHSGCTFIYPLVDLSRCKTAEAVEASTNDAHDKLGTVILAKRVRRFNVHGLI